MGGERRGVDIDISGDLVSTNPLCSFIAPHDNGQIEIDLER